MSILRIPAEAVGTFQGDYEPADFTRVDSTRGSYANGGSASYAGGGNDDFESDDDNPGQRGSLDFDDGYDCTYMHCTDMCDSIMGGGGRE